MILKSFFKQRLSPLTKRRIQNFKSNKRGFYSLWIFLLLLIVTLPAEFIANDKPLLLKYKDHFYFPVFVDYPEEVFDETVSRKIDADIYIDDKNLGGFPGWSEVWQILVPYELHQKEMEKQIAAARKNSIMKFFGKKSKQDEN